MSGKTPTKFETDILIVGGGAQRIYSGTSYYSMIVFFGAEFTKVYSDNLHGQIPASENGV